MMREGPGGNGMAGVGGGLGGDGEEGWRRRPVSD